MLCLEPTKTVWVFNVYGKSVKRKIKANICDLRPGRPEISHGGKQYLDGKIFQSHAWRVLVTALSTQLLAASGCHNKVIRKYGNSARHYFPERSYTHLGPHFQTFNDEHKTYRQSDVFLTEILNFLHSDKTESVSCI